MTTQPIGIILNGVTGRMGTNQHFIRSILAIIQQGGVRISDGKAIISIFRGIFVVWDRLFGTFVPESAAEPPRYGIVKNIDTFNPLRIAFHEWLMLGRDLLQARSRREILGFLFGPPGWRADGTGMTSKRIRAGLIARREDPRGVTL